MFIFFRVSVPNGRFESQRSWPRIESCVDCLQSAFSLKICLVLISASRLRAWVSRAVTLKEKKETETARSLKAAKDVELFLDFRLFTHA